MLLWLFKVQYDKKIFKIQKRSNWIDYLYLPLKNAKKSRLDHFGDVSRAHWSGWRVAKVEGGTSVTHHFNTQVGWLASSIEIADRFGGSPIGVPLHRLPLSLLRNYRTFGRAQSSSPSSHPTHHFIPLLEQHFKFLSASRIGLAFCV